MIPLQKKIIDQFDYMKNFKFTWLKHHEQNQKINNKFRKLLATYMTEKGLISSYNILKILKTSNIREKKYMDSFFTEKINY